MAEAAKEQVRVIERSGEGSLEAVRVTKESHQSRSPEKSQGKCSRCGWSHGTRRCPALGKTCHTCKGIGHFSTMCRTTIKKAKALVQPVSVEDEVFAIRPIAEGVPDAQKNASADSKVFHVGAIDGPGASWRQSLSTNGRTVQYKLDTGAQVIDSISCLMKFISVSLHDHVYVHEASTRLFAYGAVHPIPVKGVRSFCRTADRDNYGFTS